MAVDQSIAHRGGRRRYATEPLGDLRRARLAVGRLRLCRGYEVRAIGRRHPLPRRDEHAAAQMVVGLPLGDPGVTHTDLGVLPGGIPAVRPDQLDGVGISTTGPGEDVEGRRGDTSTGIDDGNLDRVARVAIAEQTDAGDPETFEERDVGLLKRLLGVGKAGAHQCKREALHVGDILDRDAQLTKIVGRCGLQLVGEKHDGAVSFGRRPSELLEQGMD